MNRIFFQRKGETRLCSVNQRVQKNASVFGKTHRDYLYFKTHAKNVLTRIVFIHRLTALKHAFINGPGIL